MSTAITPSVLIAALLQTGRHALMRSCAVKSALVRISTARHHASRPGQIL